MKLTIAAVGRMKAGAERQLVDRYLDRSRNAGRGVGIGEIAVIEIAEGRQGSAAGRKAHEAAQIKARIAESAIVVALDEHGKGVKSADFAKSLGRWRDDGHKELVFVVGGADGLDGEVLARADRVLAFGAMTWPHQLVRILLAEQIYRAITIMSGHPYHRE